MFFIVDTLGNAGYKSISRQKDKTMEYFVAYSILIASMLGIMVSLNALVKFKDRFYMVSTVAFYLMFLVSVTMVDAICC